MRIRFTFTIDVSKKAPASVEPHDVIEGGAYVERAEPHVLGFVIPSTERGDG